MHHPIRQAIPGSILLAGLTALAATTAPAGCRKQEKHSPNLRSPEDAAAVMRQEAQSSLSAIALAALHGYRSDRVDRNGMLLGKQFPASTGLTPKEPCCKSPDLTCHPKDEEWSRPTWKALHFKPADRHLLQYEFLSCNAPGHEQFLVRAVGAPGCGNKYLVFELKGHPITSERLPSLSEITKEIHERMTGQIPREKLACPK